MRLASSLDDPSVISATDPSGMLGLVAGTGEQLRRGFELGRGAPFLPSAEGIDAVVVCGMGGSGVAGDVLRSAFSDQTRVPIVVVKGYSLPAFCGHNSLVIVVSYSGNTEETVAAYTEAVARECRVVAVSAGGELAALSEADEIALVRIPDDTSMPRAALGYLAAAPIGILESVEVLPPSADSVDDAARALDDLALRLGPDRSSEENEAKSVAQWFAGRTPFIWGTEGPAEAAALRWKTQLNENAKIPAFHAVLSELDHNEIEGWSGESAGRFAAVVLRHGREHPRMRARVKASLAALAASGLEGREVRATGSSALAIVFSLVMLGDFVSVYTAILRGVDPTPVPVLMSLKDRLRE